MVHNKSINLEARGIQRDTITQVPYLLSLQLGVRASWRDGLKVPLEEWLPSWQVSRFTQSKTQVLLCHIPGT